MGNAAIKLELIAWLTRLDNNELIESLKLLKDSISHNQDWWDELSTEQKAGIERGLKNIEEGKTIPHEVVSKRYGL